MLSPYVHVLWGIHFVTDRTPTPHNTQGTDVARSPDGLFYGLLVLGSLVSFPANENDPKTLARCRPVIERWDQKAAETFPDNKCLGRLRGLLMAHVQRETVGLNTDAA